MNEAFSKNLNDVLVHTSVKIISQLKKDVDTAIKANLKSMEDTAKRMEQSSTNVTRFEKELKNSLIKRINSYNSSIDRLFELDGWRHMVFWSGVKGGILTPLIIIIGHFL